jgi:hypothetical protein
MDFQQGDRVKNQSMMEWGKGEILESLGAEKYKIFFVNVGEKIIDASIADLISLEGVEREDRLLDNLQVPKTKEFTKYVSIGDMVSLFRGIFPEGFYDATYIEDEREYKVKAHNLMLDLLDEPKFCGLINGKSYDEICKKALKVMRKTNLVFKNEQMALNDSLKESDNRESFSKNLFSILYEKPELSARFEDFAQCLEDINASKWTIQTYFLFITFPEQYAFMKPTVTQYAADAFAYELNYESEINWGTYKTLLEFFDYVRSKLSELDDNLKPRDMIDVQSFIWCSVPGKYY